MLAFTYIVYLVICHLSLHLLASDSFSLKVFLETASGVKTNITPSKKMESKVKMTMDKQEEKSNTKHEHKSNTKQYYHDQYKSKKDKIHASDSPSRIINLGGDHGKYANGILLPIEYEIPSFNSNKEEFSAFLSITPQDILNLLKIDFLSESSSSSSSLSKSTILSGQSIESTISLSSLSIVSDSSILHCWMDLIFDYKKGLIINDEFWNFITSSLKRLHTFIYRVGLFIEKYPKYKHLRDFVDSICYKYSKERIAPFHLLKVPGDPFESSNLFYPDDLTEFLGNIKNFICSSKFETWPDELCVMEIASFNPESCMKMFVAFSNPSPHSLDTSFISDSSILLSTIVITPSPASASPSLNIPVLRIEREKHKIAQMLFYSMKNHQVDDDKNPFLCKVLKGLDFRITFDILGFLFEAIKSTIKSNSKDNYSLRKNVGRRMGFALEVLKCFDEESEKFKIILSMIAAIDERVSKGLSKLYGKHDDTISKAFKDSRKPFLDKDSTRSSLYIQPLTTCQIGAFNKKIFRLGIDKFGRRLCGILNGHIDNQNRLEISKIQSGLELVIVRNGKIYKWKSKFQLLHNDLVILCKIDQKKEEILILDKSLIGMNLSGDIPLEWLPYFYYYHDWPFVGLIKKDQDEDWEMILKKKKIILD